MYLWSIWVFKRKTVTILKILEKILMMFFQPKQCLKVIEQYQSLPSTLFNVLHFPCWPPLKKNEENYDEREIGFPASWRIWLLMNEIVTLFAPASNTSFSVKLGTSVPINVSTITVWSFLKRVDTKILRSMISKFNNTKIQSQNISIRCQWK